MSAIAKDEFLYPLLPSELGFMIIGCCGIKKKGVSDMWR